MNIAKKFLGVFLSFSVILGSIAFSGLQVQAASGTTYYVSYSGGSDSNNGTSSSTPWKTLAKVSGITFVAGDQILLKCGDQWSETLTLNGSGTSANPVTVSSYGSGNKPKISPQVNDSDCIKIINQAGFKIDGLDLSNAMNGVYMEYIDNWGKDYVEIDNCYFHELNDTYNTNPNIYNHFSSGINFSSYNSTDGDTTALTNLKVNNCTFDNCNVGFWSGEPWSLCNQTTGFIDSGHPMYMGNASFTNLVATNCKQWGYSFQWFKTAAMNNCDCYNVGWGTNQYGAAGLLVGWSRDVTFDYCDAHWVYRGAEDYDGCGFDFEGGGNSTQNLYYRNSTVEYTDGCGIFIFNNQGYGGISNCQVTNDTISYFGQNPGSSSTSEGINIYGGTSQTWSTGVISNNTFNRDNARAYYNGYPSAVNGFTISGNTYNQVDSPSSWDFGYKQGRQNWGNTSNGVSIGMTQESLDLTTTAADPYIVGPTISISASNKNLIRVKMKNNTASTTGELYWITSTDQNWNTNKKQQFTMIANDSNSTEYIIDLSKNSYWSGTITGLRLDPSDVTSGSCNIDYVKIEHSVSTPVISWEFSSGLQSWTANSDVQNYVWQSGGYEGGTFTGSGDPQTISPDNLAIDISKSKTIQIVMKNASSTTSGEIYFTTTADTSWNQSKHATFTIKPNDTGYSTYTIDMSGIAGWTGTLKQFRVDPSVNATSGTFSIDSIRIQATSVAWDYCDNAEGWSALNNISTLTVSNGSLNGTINGADPYITSENNMTTDISNNDLIMISMRNNTSSTTGNIYFMRNGDTTWTGDRGKSFSIIPNDPRSSIYIIDMSTVANWNGTLKILRVDPEEGASSGSFTIDWIRIIPQKRYDFTSDVQNWSSANNISGFGWQTGGYIGGTVTGGDAQIVSPSNLTTDISDNKTIKICMKNATTSTSAQIFYETSSTDSWTEQKSKSFTINANDTGYTVYTIDMSHEANWTGTLTCLRIDPDSNVTSGTFSIDYVYILR